MKKITFLKTLLMAVGLCVGASAWAGELFSLTKDGPFCSGGTFTTVAESGKSMGFTMGTTYASGWYTSSSESRRLVVSLSNALAEGDVIKLTCAINSAGGEIVLYDYTDTENVTKIGSMTLPTHTQNEIITATYTVPAEGALIGQTSIGFGIGSAKKDVYMHQVTVERDGYSSALYKPETLTEATTINVSNILSATSDGELAASICGTNYLIGKGMTVRTASKTIDGTSYTKGAQSSGDMSNIGTTELTNGILFMVPAGYGKVTLHFTKDGGYNYLRYSLGMTINEITVASSSATTREFIYNTPVESAIVVSANTKRGSSATFYAIKWEPLTVSGNITDAGWSTFASSYPLDLSTISGGTAYYASAASGSTVTLTSTTAKVPAGEGVMVKGTAGNTFTISAALSGTAIDGNLLKGQTTTGNVAASTSGAYHYVFGYENSSVYGFYNLAAETEVPAGKAYLETTEELSAAASRLTIVFGDETTGITSVNGEGYKADGYYNLAGQRVDAPKKGLYIVNGKKVMVK